ncbi:MAG: hypothetical protein ABEI99_11720 [Halobaculum sp.]
MKGVGRVVVAVAVPWRAVRSNPSAASVLFVVAEIVAVAEVVALAGFGHDILTENAARVRSTVEQSAENEPTTKILRRTSEP